MRRMVLGSGGVCTATGVPASNSRQLLPGSSAAAGILRGGAPQYSRLMEWDHTLEAAFAELAVVQDRSLAAGDDSVTKAALLDCQHKLRLEAKHTRTIRTPWAPRKGRPERRVV